MIAHILFSWNELTIVLAIWFAVVSLALAVDFGPEIYQEKVAGKTVKELLGIKSPVKLLNNPVLTKVYDLDNTYVIHGRHAKR